MKRILVTGGGGFIGSHSVDLLLDRGYRVIIIDNLVTGKLSYVNLFHPNVEFIQRDMLDYPKLVKEVARCDAVLHLAALSSVPKSIEDPVASQRINMLGFIYVLQALREIKKPIRLVYASSAAVYGNAECLPCSDEIPLTAQALSPYALEKANNERYAELYSHLFKIKSLGLRYFNVYGPRQDPKSPYSGVIAKFIEQYNKPEPITVLGDGTQSRDFIYVSDVARANLLAIESDYCGVLNIATGQAETIKNLAQYIQEAGNHPAEMDFMRPRAGDILHSYATIQKAEKVLGFRSEISLKQGIALLMDSKVKDRVVT